MRAFSARLTAEDTPTMDMRVNVLEVILRRPVGCAGFKLCVHLTGVDDEVIKAAHEISRRLF